MNEWRRVALRHVSTHIKDGTHGTHRRVESGIPLLSAKNVGRRGHLEWDKSDDLISESDYAALTSTFAPKAGDLLLTVVGSIGRSAVFDGSRVAFQRSVAFVRSSDAVLPCYLFQVSRSEDFSRQLERRCNVTAQAGLYLGELAKISIPLPPKQQQQKIAAILTSIDTAIEKTEALIAKYQQIKAGLMHDLFTRGVLPNGQLRPLRERAPALYQETAIGWIPRAWRLTQAGHLCSLITKGTTPTSADMWESSEGIRFLRVDNLTFDGRFDFTASSYRISELTHTTALSRSKCFPGDVLMNIVGPPLGKVSLVTPETGEVNINQAIAIFRPTVSLSSTYLLRWLLSSGARRWLLQRAKQTSGQLNLTLAMCQELEIPLPSIEEQELMESRLQAAEGLIQSEQTRLSKLQTQKLGLMQDLLTGKVAVRADAPAPEAAA